MSTPAITVDGLAKAYRIGLKEEIPDTLVGAVTSWSRAPLRNFRRLRQLNTFALKDDADEGLFWALKGVSFDVAEGEVLGIIGRNGAGKSTLLKILSRITEPTRGRAVIRGRVSSLLEVGTGFHPELSGRENIYMNGTILGMRKREIDRKLDQIIDFSGVERFLDTPIKRYSSGMKVRLAFSVAAHLEPEILIIDEVLAVGDAEFQKKCLGKMHDVARGGRTVLFVSHQLGAIESLCHRVIVLNSGEKVQDGPPRECIEAYLSASGGDGHAGGRRRPPNDDAPAWISHVSLLNAAGAAVESVACGQPFALEICVQTREALANPHCVVQVHSLSGQRLFRLSSLEDCRGPASPSTTVILRAAVGACPLAPGSYDVAVRLRDGAAETLDDLPLALRIRVEPAPLAGHRSPTGKRDILCLPCYWSRTSPVNGSPAIPLHTDATDAAQVGVGS